MASPLSGSIAATVYKSFKSIFLDATLTRDTVAASSPDVSFDPPAPTTTDYACKAIRDNYNLHDMATNLIQAGDAKVLILAGSLSVTPANQDRVTIQGSTFTIVDVLSDPTNAVWVCQVRK